MYYVGIDLGGTNIAVGIVDKNLKIVQKGSVPTFSTRSEEAIVKDMATLTEKLLKDAGIPLSDVAYVGIAAPGTVNRTTGIIEYTNNLPFRNFPVVECFKKYFPISQVLIENDANAAALGETLAGAAMGAKDSVMITLGTGVGGGIIIGGKIYAGFNMAAGELGHIVIDHGGRLCSCGRRGCWEAYSSATALTRMTKEKIAECQALLIPSLMIEDSERIGKVNARTAFSAMKKGDKPAKEVVDAYINYLACGLTNIINIFQPEILCIGGGICNEGSYLLDPLMEKVSHEQYTRAGKEKAKIVIAKLGNDAGIIGAACLGMEN